MNVNLKVGGMIRCKKVYQEKVQGIFRVIKPHVKTLSRRRGCCFMVLVFKGFVLSGIAKKTYYF